uniref:Uncharacterized protein n=1 Tax=Anguilla anguilla TaxID=7936 RepID=A0A0E9RJR4_ANGAN
MSFRTSVKLHSTVPITAYFNFICILFKNNTL